ncbi:Hypothetical predicted protein [Octopus vulgaris]|uniref:Uncharacterized protein n=1 Tax=Octopus vulgaris TaxID=6645 RepID=A0AA36AXD1_OCTVU|nr:Hypothetical predicted protein [Octopus vulgaris]
MTTLDRMGNAGDVKRALDFYSGCPGHGGSGGVDFSEDCRVKNDDDVFVGDDRSYPTLLCQSHYSQVHTIRCTLLLLEDRQNVIWESAVLPLHTCRVTM